MCIWAAGNAEHDIIILFKCAATEQQVFSLFQLHHNIGFYCYF